MLKRHQRERQAVAKGSSERLSPDASMERIDYRDECGKAKAAREAAARQI